MHADGRSRRPRVAEPARHVEQLVLVAREAAPVRIAARAAYAVAVDAELLTRSAVTARAGERVKASLNTVHPPAA